MERRIVLFGPPGRDAMHAEKVLSSAGITVGHCANEPELLVCLEQGAGAVMLTEEMLEGRARQALSSYLARQPAWADLPILLLTKHGADSLEAQRAFENLGNVTLLERPVRTMALVSAARSALRARDRQYEMRALNRRKDEFLATLAHELRNPLAPIVNAMEIIQRMHPTPSVGKLSGIVDRQVTHLKRLIDDLLDVARITNGKLELQRSLTTVDKVVTHAVEIAQQGLLDHRHRLTVVQPEEEVRLHADHVRLVQSLANLLVNAGKFTPPSGDIRLTVTVDGTQAEFAVQDSGKGLEPAFRERMFEMFAQSRIVGQPTSGLGLGLHLSRAFAQLHGGTLTAHSDGPGKGSLFVLTVPAVVQKPVQEVVSEPSRAAALHRKILVVDDNLDAASTLAALLTLQGASVSTAHDGAQAVAAVRQDLPDAVVMDIGMPVMNGYEAARRIRAEHGGQAPALIALTGWGQYADRELAAQAGFDHHFVKPLDIGQLLACLAATGTAVAS